MNDLGPESAQDTFEVEVSDLAPGDDGQASPPMRVSSGPRLSRRARVWRVISVGSALLALIVILGSNATWRRQALDLFPSAPAATPTPVTIRLPPLSSLPTPQDWLRLQARPVILPALAPGSRCPTTRGQPVSVDTGLAVGSGPIYAIYGGGSAADGVLQYQDASFLGKGGASEWSAQAVAWAISPNYAGPALIRGRQLDGPNALLFNGGIDQQNFVGSWSREPLLTTLRLIGSRDSVTWAYWGTFTRVRAPGCYAYQVDGLTFSYLIIFQALPEDGA